MTKLQPGTTDWERAVAEGIEAESSRNWALGDIALVIAPMDDHHDGEGIAEEHPAVLANLARYAEDIGVDEERLRVYRQVAHAWPPAERLRQREASGAAVITEPAAAMG